ncbi:hypothetical protein A6U86_32605 [Rhizobium sp. AC27/96]|nr:hypothetical protein A6U86_32605 [Rhizobium sp. AC27/96]
MQLTRKRCAGDGADISPVDAKVFQLAAGHATKFVNGLTEPAPVVERACYVHDNPLSEGYDVSNLAWLRRRFDD